MQKVLKALFWPDRHLMGGLAVLSFIVAGIAIVVFWKFALIVAGLAVATYSLGLVFGAGFRGN